ncbi:hypothetical protein Pfo_027176 [Paulownia fortunei]|nr:hypothetical protein Pfo_027176 [Paulownia fortunei]
MEEECPLLTWAYYHQEEGIEELKNSVYYSTLELEAAALSAHDELSRKDEEILQLKGLIANIIKERDEFQGKFQALVLEKQLLFQQIQKQHLDSAPSSGTTSNEDENTDLIPSDCDENINVVPSPGKDLKLPQVLGIAMSDKILPTKPLPEKGKFLQAVMEAGPLLQTLLVAGPLPQWQRPPPRLSSVDIPPVTISSPGPRIVHQDSCLVSPGCGGFSHKRAKVNMEGTGFSPKYQKKLCAYQSSLAPTTSSVCP